MKVHHLKTWPEVFWPMADGKKLFDLRKDDGRDFQVGDILRLAEFTLASGFTGEVIEREVTYVMRNCSIFGLKAKFVCMSLKPENLSTMKVSVEDLLRLHEKPTKPKKSPAPKRPKARKTASAKKTQ